MNYNIDIKLSKESFSEIDITFPLTLINSQIDNKLKQLSKTMSIKGFRPGKVPMDIVSNLAKEEASKDIILNQSNQILNEYFGSREDVILFNAPVVSNIQMEGNNVHITLIAYVLNSPDLVNIDANMIIAVPKYVEGDLEIEDKLIKFAAKNSKFLEKVDNIEHPERTAIFINNINGVALSRNIVLLLDYKKTSINDYLSKQVGDIIRVSFAEYPGLAAMVNELTELQEAVDEKFIDCKIFEIYYVNESKVTAADIVANYKLDKKQFSEEELSSSKNILTKLVRESEKNSHTDLVDLEIVKYINNVIKLHIPEDLVKRFLSARASSLYGLEYPIEKFNDYASLMSMIAFSIFSSKIVKHFKLHIDPKVLLTLERYIVINHYNTYLTFTENPVTINEFVKEHLEIINEDLKAAVAKKLALDYIKSKATIQEI